MLRLQDYGLRPGCRADFIVFDASSPATVIAEVSAPLMGFKGGRQTFNRLVATLIKPR
jgi:cytosine deaminase